MLIAMLLLIRPSPIGYLQVRGDVPTDPFMMLVVPDDRFTGGSGFGTANFCLDRGVGIILPTRCMGSFVLSLVF